jgi:hypothetical protein
MLISMIIYRTYFPIVITQSTRHFIHSHARDLGASPYLDFCNPLIENLELSNVKLLNWT